MEKKERIDIPKELKAKVLFDADMTCCICRNPSHGVQIHHIDGNPANNSYENLAAICLGCHSHAHSSNAFVQNLNGDVIALFNNNWREIVLGRHRPPPPASRNYPEEDQKLLELRHEVLLEFELVYQEWMCQQVMEFSAWGKHAYQVTESQNSVPLANRPIPRMLSPEFMEVTYRSTVRIEHLLSAYPQGITVTMQINVIRAVREVRGILSDYHLRLKNKEIWESTEGIDRVIRQREKIQGQMMEMIDAFNLLHHHMVSESKRLSANTLEPNDV